MRIRSNLWVSTCVLVALGCSANKAGTGAGVSPSAGSSGLGSGGMGSINPGAGGSSVIVPIEVAGGAPVDPDPTNPNIAHPTCGSGNCTDFPVAPLMGAGVPENAATLFGAADNFTPGAFCALEPQLSNGDKPGAMLPANWVRPRFRVAAPAGIDLLEIRLHSPVEKNDLVAYTMYTPGTGGVAPSWYLPKEIWNGTTTPTSPPSGAGLANNAAGQPITVTIRGVNTKQPGPPIGIKGDFNIAPVVATGSMVFWTVNSGNVTPDSSKLLGFAVGDEGVAVSLTLPGVKWTGEIGEDGAVLRGFYDKVKLPGFVDGQVRCIGCHTTIPDGSGVVYDDDWPWSKAAAALTTGAVPASIGAGAQAIMKTPWWGQQSMTAAHWKAGDKTMVTTYGTTFTSGKARTLPWQALPSYNGTDGATADDKVKWHSLAWIDMESNAAVNVTIAATNDYGSPALMSRQTAVTAAKGTAWGLIATGDTNTSAVSPEFNHAGDTIVYTTTDYSPDGHPDAAAKTADIRTVPYNNRAGGTSQALAGASDPGVLEYYPSYSSDDKLIAFTQSPNPTAAVPDGPYYNRFGKVMVIPAAGGTATALAANDPGTCGGDTLTAGIINSWPKWSPDAFSFGGKTYYFLVFSSARKYSDEFSKQFELPSNPLANFQGLHASSQLYLAAVVRDDATGTVTTYPAVYIWNQNRTPGSDGMSASLQYSNLTPAWDALKLPPLVIEPVPTETIPK